MELGGNIALTGFSQLSRGEMVVVKKLVGNYTRKFSDGIEGFESVKISMKPVHKAEGAGKYEVHGHATVAGKVFVSEDTNHNLFFAVDAVLKRIENQVMK